MAINILHVLSDEKFIDKHILKFLDTQFNNTYVYLKKENAYKGKNKAVYHVKPESVEYYEVIKNIHEYHIVILYYLNVDKVMLFEHIRHSKVKIIWSFYGAELYSLKDLRRDFLSELTRKALGKRSLFKLVSISKDSLRTLYYRITGRLEYHVRLKDSFDRIDFFLWYNKYEYDFLNKKLGGKLPNFLQSTLNNKMDDVVPKFPKDNSVIIGNSANPFNNHVDALSLLIKQNFSGEVVLPFSYGGNARYIRTIKEMSSIARFKVTFIEHFLLPDQYISFLNSHRAFILPSFRQMGLGNIFIAMRCGMKIYLSRKNPTFQWLKVEGFKIHSIEDDLEKDIVLNNLDLTSQEVAENNSLYTKFVASENNISFFRSLENMSEVDN